MSLSRRHFVCAATALAPVTTFARAADLPTVRIAGPPIEGFTVIYYGVRSGLFARHGVNVEIVTLNSGAAATAALVGGSVDVAWPTALALFQAHLRGIPLQIVGPGNLYRSEAPAFVLCVKNDAPIHSARDLNGKIVATQSIKDLNWAGISAWTDANGGDSTTFKLIELPLSAIVPALAEGRIDAANVGTPFLEAGLATGTIRKLAQAYDVIGKRFLLGVYISTPTAIAANRDAMARFVTGLHEATVYVNAHLAETVDLVVSVTGADPAAVRRSTRTVDAEYVLASDVQPLMDVVAKYKVIDHAFPVTDLFSSVMLRRP